MPRGPFCRFVLQGKILTELLRQLFKNRFPEPLFSLDIPLRAYK